MQCKDFAELCVRFCSKNNIYINKYVKEKTVLVKKVIIDYKENTKGWAITTRKP